MHSVPIDNIHKLSLSQEDDWVKHVHKLYICHTRTHSHTHAHTHIHTYTHIHTHTHAPTDHSSIYFVRTRQNVLTRKVGLVELVHTSTEKQTHTCIHSHMYTQTHIICIYQ